MQDRCFAVLANYVSGKFTLGVIALYTCLRRGAGVHTMYMEVSNALCKMERGTEREEEVEDLGHL